MPIANATSRTGVPRADSPRRAIVCMLVAALVLTLSDTLTKVVREGLPAGEVLFLRSLVIYPLIALIAARGRASYGIRVYDLRSQLIGGLCMAGSTFAFVTGLGLLPLATCVSVGFAGPLFVTALAPYLLGEAVGWRRFTAVVAGFLGVLVITRPTGAGLNWAVMLPLVAALFSGLRDIMTRRMSVTESSLSILFVSTVALTLGGLVTVPFGWRMPTTSELANLAVAGLVQAFGHFLAIEALRWGQAALVIPFKYTSLVWATAYGYLIWRDVPSANVVIGALIILLSSLYIFRREIVLGRQRREKDELGPTR